MAGKTFPAFPAHAQPAVLQIWQEAHMAIRHIELTFSTLYVDGLTPLAARASAGIVMTAIVRDILLP